MYNKYEITKKEILEKLQDLLTNDDDNWIMPQLYLLYELNMITADEFKFSCELYSHFGKKEKLKDEYYSLILTDADWNLETYEEIEYDLQGKYDRLQKKMTPELEKILSLMPYEMFLYTKYWEVISTYKKTISGNKCQLCNSNKYLNTHHNNYKNRGAEYRNLNDLVIICNKCNSKFHNKD
jgi:hypothetical protein